MVKESGPRPEGRKRSVEWTFSKFKCITFLRRWNYIFLKDYHLNNLISRTTGRLMSKYIIMGTEIIFYCDIVISSMHVVRDAVHVQYSFLLKL